MRCNRNATQAAHGRRDIGTLAFPQLMGKVGDTTRELVEAYFADAPSADSFVDPSGTSSLVFLRDSISAIGSGVGRPRR